MKRTVKKLRSSCGESIVETLAAILVITFAGLFLFASIITAARINKTVEDTNAEFHTQLLTAEQQSGNLDGTVTIRDSGLFIATLDVEYTGGSGQLTSYRIAEGGG